MRTTALFVAALLSATVAFSGEPMSLLSGNINPGGKSKLFPEGSTVIATRASYSLIETGEFATDTGTVAIVRKFGIKVLFDGGDWWKSQTYGAWDGGKWVTVRIDLKKPYLIGEADVWACRDPMHDTDKADILFSSDGDTYTQHGAAENNADTAQTTEKNHFVKLSEAFDKPVLARFIELRIHRAPAAHQQQISEIAVWGWAAEKTSNTVGYLKADDRPLVKFSIRPIQDGAALISWAPFAKVSHDVTQWKLYTSGKPFTKVDAAGVTLHDIFSKSQTSAPVFPFEPGSTVYFAMSASYGGAEYPLVDSVPCRFRTPYECGCFGDMLAINYCFGGGGSSRGNAWEEVALTLLEETPFRESRWWFMYPETVKRFLSHGIGMITWPNNTAGNIKNANSLGLYSFTRGNEPELNGLTPEAYLSGTGTNLPVRGGLKKDYAAAKALSKWNTLAAPTCNIGPTPREWLDKFYAAGAKDFFDVLDLHTYCGPPENLFKDVQAVRDIMKKYGDDNKPVISTEFGYADCPAGPHRISPLQKAQYLVRGLVIHYALGFKRVYVYSFFDAGTDPYYNEHHFGMLDFDLQKKPAFHAINALGKQLGDCVLEGAIEGCKPPTIGYLFKSLNSAEYVAIAWDASGGQAGAFTCDSPEITMADMFGETRRIMIDSSKTFSLPYGPSPVYIRSKSPVKMLSCQRIEGTPAAEAGSKVSFAVAAQNVVVKDDATSGAIDVILNNGFDMPVDCALTIKGADDVTLGSHLLTVTNRAELHEKVPFTLALSEDLALKRYNVLLSYKTKWSSYSDETSIYVRRLTPVSNGVVCATKRFQGVSQPIYILANKSVEVSFDPSQGGRMLELIDRGTLSNQIHIEYDKIPVLKSFPFEYAIWFKIGKGLKNDPWTVADFQNGSLKLSALEGTSGSEAIMQWSLDDAKPVLKLDAHIANKSGKSGHSTFYMHPEYNASGDGTSTSDLLSFPIKGGLFSLPFWTGLGERNIAPLVENWWRIRDTVSGLEMRQDYSDGWSNPRIWFGNNTCNIEMTHEAELASGAEWHGWLTWALSSPVLAGKDASKAK